MSDVYRESYLAEIELFSLYQKLQVISTVEDPPIKEEAEEVSGMCLYFFNVCKHILALPYDSALQAWQELRPNIRLNIVLAQRFLSNGFLFV